MKRYQVQFRGTRRVKAIFDTDDYEKAIACRDAQAPEGWVIDTDKFPERWIAD